MKKCLILLIFVLCLSSCYLSRTPEKSVSESPAETNEPLAETVKIDYRSQKAIDYTKGFTSKRVYNSDLQKMELTNFSSFTQITNLLSEEQINNIISLNISCENIFSLDGIQKFSNVDWLVLKGLRATDFSVLSQLEKLKELYLFYPNETVVASLNDISAIPMLLLDSVVINEATFTYPKYVRRIDFYDGCTGDVLEVLKRLPDSVELITIPLSIISSFEDIVFLEQNPNLKDIGIFITGMDQEEVVNQGKEIIKNKNIFSVFLETGN